MLQEIDALLVHSEVMSFIWVGYVALASFREAVVEKLVLVVCSVVVCAIRQRCQH